MYHPHYLASLVLMYYHHYLASPVCAAGVMELHSRAAPGRAPLEGHRHVLALLLSLVNCYNPDQLPQGYQVDHSLPQRLYQRNDLNVLLEHVGLIRVFPLAVHLFFKC